MNFKAKNNKLDPVPLSIICTRVWYSVNHKTWNFKWKLKTWIYNDSDHSVPSRAVQTILRFLLIFISDNSIVYPMMIKEAKGRSSATACWKSQLHVESKLITNQFDFDTCMLHSVWFKVLQNWTTQNWPSFIVFYDNGNVRVICHYACTFCYFSFFINEGQDQRQIL